MKTTIQYLYIAILLFAPLAFGTTETWARLLISFAIFLCGTLFFNELRRRKRRLLEVPGLLPLLAFGAVMIFQILPLPAFVVKLISPAMHTLYQDTAGLLGPVKWMRLTVDFKTTLLQFIQFSAFVLFYLLTIQLLSRAEFLRRVVLILIRYGLILAFLSLLNHISMPEKLLWLRESSQGMSFGPYANRNHYGGLMVMLFPVVFSMLLYNKPRISGKGFGERIKAVLNHLSGNFYLFLVLAAIVMGASVFASFSRAGIVCLSLALSFMGIFMANRKNIGRRKGITVALMAGVILLSVGWLGWEPIFSPFDKLGEHREKLAEERLAAWQETVGIVKSYPIFGTGAGTFPHAHKAFRKTASENGSSEHAYNTYLEILADQGILGLGCFLTFLLAVFASIRQFLKRKEIYSIYLFLGAVTGLTAILIFCLVENQLQNGANAVYFFFLSGLCIAAAHTRIRSLRHPTLLKTNQKEWLEPVAGSVTAFLFFWGTAFFGGAYLGELHLDNIMHYYAGSALTGGNYDTVVDRASKAALYDPLESRNLIVLANAQSALMAKEDRSLDLLDRAIRVNPMNSGNLQAVANYFSNNGLFSLAQKFYQAALKYDPANSRIHGEHGYWLMAQGFLKEGVKEMQTAIALSPRLTKMYVGKMAKLDLSYDEMVVALPEMVRPFLELGEYLVKVGQKKLALRAYQRAKENLAGENVIQADWIQRLCRFYMAQGMLNDAFNTASAGIKYLPKDSDLRYIMGTIYEKMGVTYRAAEEYKLAVVLNPENLSAKKGLEKIEDQI